MKNYLLIVAMATLLFACGSGESESEPTKPKEVAPAPKLPMYSTVKELLNAAGDYSEEDGTLKFLSENRSDYHVQVSKPILEADFEDVKKEIVKRDLVYVAYQVFAQTDLDTIQITSIPVDLNNSTKYYKAYKVTATINREKAKAVMKKYAGTTDFSALFKPISTVWVPSEKFDLLKFKNLDLVFFELTAP